MAPLPANNTSRLFIDYSANGREHTLMLRYPDDTSPPDSTVLEGIDDFLIACNPLMPTNWVFQGWRYSLEGSLVTLPLGGAPTTFAGTATAVTAEAPAYITFVGRSVLGRRARIFLLGAGFTPAQEQGTLSDYRLYRSENAAVDAAYIALEASLVQAIDDANIDWYNYANLGYNAYWQRAVRA